MSSWHNLQVHVWLQAWGHSTVIGPFAEVIATTEHEPTIVYADIDFAQVRTVVIMQTLNEPLCHSDSLKHAVSV